MNTHINSLITEGKKQHPATLVVLALICIGALLGLITTIFASNDRVGQINAQILQLQDKINPIKYDWAKLNDLQVDYESKIADIIEEKKILEEGAGNIRHQIQKLEEEKKSIQAKRMGLTLGAN